MSGTQTNREIQRLYTLQEAVDALTRVYEGIVGGHVLVEVTSAQITEMVERITEEESEGDESE